MRRLLTLLPLVLVLAGCGQAVQDSAGDFEGEERAVAQVVEDIQEAGERNDAERLCSELLARELADQLGQGGSTCAEELGNAIDDAGDFELVVRDVTVEGDTATAVVERGPNREAQRAVFTFRKISGAWRATALAGDAP